MTKCKKCGYEEPQKPYLHFYSRAFPKNDYGTHIILISEKVAEKLRYYTTLIDICYPNGNIDTFDFRPKEKKDC